MAPHDMGTGEDIEQRFKDAAAKERRDNASQQKAQEEAAAKGDSTKHLGPKDDAKKQP